MNKECFDKIPKIETERLIMRAFNETDFQEYVTWHCGDILYYMRGIHYIKEDDIDGFKRFFFKNVPRMLKTKESIIWCIAEKTTNRNIGKIELCKFDFNVNCAEIGYCLSKEERTKGYMTEAVNAILKWGFESLELNRIYSHVWDENKASSSVLEKCNFKLEGLLRENDSNNFTFDGHEIKDTKKEKLFVEQKSFKNVRVYGLLKNEYQRTK